MIKKIRFFCLIFLVALFSLSSIETLGSCEELVAARDAAEKRLRAAESWVKAKKDIDWVDFIAYLFPTSDKNDPNDTLSTVEYQQDQVVDHAKQHLSKEEREDIDKPLGFLDKIPVVVKGGAEEREKYRTDQLKNRISEEARSGEYAAAQAAYVAAQKALINCLELKKKVENVKLIAPCGHPYPGHKRVLCPFNAAKQRCQPGWHYTCQGRSHTHVYFGSSSGSGSDSNRCPICGKLHTQD